jgi:hypothetical protein
MVNSIQMFEELKSSYKGWLKHKKR